jgi:hypothetical protein
MNKKKVGKMNSTKLKMILGVVIVLSSLQSLAQEASGDNTVANVDKLSFECSNSNGDEIKIFNSKLHLGTSQVVLKINGVTTIQSTKISHQISASMTKFVYLVFVGENQASEITVVKQSFSGKVGSCRARFCPGDGPDLFETNAILKVGENETAFTCL